MLLGFVVFWQQQSVLQTIEGNVSLKYMLLVLVEECGFQGHGEGTKNTILISIGPEFLLLQNAFQADP